MNSRQTEDGRPSGLSSDDGAASVSTLRASIPDAVIEQVLKMGLVEWGATAEQRAEQHVDDFRETLRMTREAFNYADVPVRLHGLYLEGTETVLCHTGTSPNSGANAQALAGAWNWLHEQCAAQAIEARRAETGTGSVHESAVRKDAP